MSTTVPIRTLEAEIADCCRAIYWTREPEVAMSNWDRLRRLTASMSVADIGQFIRETLDVELKKRKR